MNSILEAIVEHFRSTHMHDIDEEDFSEFHDMILTLEMCHRVALDDSWDRWGSLVESSLV